MNYLNVYVVIKKYIIIQLFKIVHFTKNKKIYKGFPFFLKFKEMYYFKNNLNIFILFV